MVVAKPLPELDDLRLEIDYLLRVIGKNQTELARKAANQGLRVYQPSISRLLHGKNVRYDVAVSIFNFLLKEAQPFRLGENDYVYRLMSRKVLSLTGPMTVAAALRKFEGKFYSYAPYCPRDPGWDPEALISREKLARLHQDEAGTQLQDVLRRIQLPVRGMNDIMIHEQYTLGDARAKWHQGKAVLLLVMNDRGGNPGRKIAGVLTGHDFQKAGESQARQPT